MVVRLGLNFSHAFELQCGVRQGGVLSPVMFAVYIDGIVDKFVDCGLGCWCGDVFVGCICCMQMTYRVAQQNGTIFCMP